MVSSRRNRMVKERTLSRRRERTLLTIRLGVSEKKADGRGTGVFHRLEVFSAQSKRTRLAISLDVGEKSCVGNIPYVLSAPP
mmetsp:Transcript_7792/g.16877  ORF Transcript_7792/g.16877 Transcript_7792/m.16877 type:complete len:82 (+) Transcript_7792:249-494(+)